MAVKIVENVRGLNPDWSPLKRTGSLYAVPNYTDIHVKSSTTQWQVWTGMPSVQDSRWKLAIAIPISDMGQITVTLPFTDTEMYRKAGGSLKWQIWDAEAGVYYEGALPSSLIASEYSLKDLLSLPVGAWTITPIASITPSPGSGVPTTQEFTATPSQTIYTLSASAVRAHVSRNGIRCKQVSSGPASADEYTHAGNTITIGAGIGNGERLTVDYWI